MGIYKCSELIFESSIIAYIGSPSAPSPVPHSPSFSLYYNCKLVATMWLFKAKIKYFFRAEIMLPCADYRVASAFPNVGEQRDK